MLRLFEDTLAPGAACALPARPRVLYVRAGDLEVHADGPAARVAADAAWHAAGACAVTAGPAGAPVLRYELAGGAAGGAAAGGGAGFESGREPVRAVASTETPTSFVRVAILPRELRGRSSIVYVNPADAARGRPRRYTVFVDEPVEL